ncbi:MAG TPA: hypothetical protein VMS75_06060 [Terriglobales bacterium]|nr:hypothetical protein [Terriglobales bacterium]
MSKRQGLLGAAALVAAVLMVAAAPAKPDFSGVWVVNVQKSQLAAWARFDSTTITIEHKEPKFRFHRVSVKAGKTDEVSWELTTDGVEKVEKEGGGASHSWLTWDGEVLVYFSHKVLPNGREARDIVRYTLRDGGKTFVAEEKFRGPLVKYDNLWVADKKD